MTFPRITRITAVAAAATLALAAAAATSAMAQSHPTAMRPKANIVQVASSAGQFTTLVKLTKAAGLANTLAGPGRFTVFAPTDQAFAKVPKKTLNSLMQNKAKLRRVLLYHVVSGEVKAEQVVGLKSAKTLAKQPVRISVRNGAVYLNKTTKIVKTDIPASNGVIHVINAVLIPPA